MPPGSQWVHQTERSNCDAVGVPADRCRQPLLRATGCLHPVHGTPISGPSGQGRTVSRRADHIFVGDMPYNFNFTAADALIVSDAQGPFASE